MIKRHKDLLRPLVANLRTTLAGAASAEGAWQRGDLDRELERLGIAPDGTATPIDALPNATPNERRARAAADAYLAAAVNGAKGAEAEQRRRAAREEFVDRAAYTWINRLLALRTMEARGLIDETLRTNPDYEGIPEALFVLRQTDATRCAGADGGWWAVIENACATQVASLPGLFDLSDPAAALRPSTAALLRCVTLIGGTPVGFALEEADAAFADPDAIGWAYQFYQEAAKARVYAKLGSGGKAATRAEIAAATQLFTEPYMVQWLLQNSLGRSYHEAYPNSKLPATWAYYIRQRPEGQTVPESPRPLEALDLIDPCCGSGHFLREAFDMFAAMYRECHPELSTAEIADRVLERHLHGIDLDPRAAQLAALTLYLRAWELVRDERKMQRQPGISSYRPAAMNIATTPSGLSAGALQRHLRRHPQDRLLAPLLEGVFEALEQADILGSLLRPAEHIEAAMKALQQPHTIPMDFDADDAALRRTITTMARHDPAELKRMLLDRVAQSFHAESGDTADMAAQLFGREAEGGVRLLQLLDRKYAVVVTNPPYMGSSNMDASLKKYVEQNYRSGKRDLYAAFILRCLNICHSAGSVAMVTQQGWMFLSSYADLRAIPEDKSLGIARKSLFQGILRETGIEALVHLGRYAFSELGNAAVAPLLFILRNNSVTTEHQIWACRLAAPRPSNEQAQLLAQFAQIKTDVMNEVIFTPFQISFLPLAKSPLAYYLSTNIITVLSQKTKLLEIADVREGLHTTSNLRFLRFDWECPWSLKHKRWVCYEKGGGYARWTGTKFYSLDWQYLGARIKSSPNPVVPSEDRYFLDGLTYSFLASGSLGVRDLRGDSIFDSASHAIHIENKQMRSLQCYLNCRSVTYMLRSISQSIRFNKGYVETLPVPSQEHLDELDFYGNFCFELKRHIVEFILVERDCSAKVDRNSSEVNLLSAYLLLTESIGERLTNRALSLQSEDIITIYGETGMPAAFHSLINGYDVLPELPADLGLPPLPRAALDYLASHKRIAPPSTELQRIKTRLRGLYEAGPGIKENEEAADTAEGAENEGETTVSGAHIPIPTETFLEELSIKMQIHPISVYWLLEELRREGARCKPEEQRLLEDRLSVLVLRLLGHRWPKQIESGEPVPAWADADGIIPITTGAGEQTLAERVRTRLRAEDGDLGAQRIEALLTELTGLDLDEWIRREFFKHHTRQFKYRPVAWHLASLPSAAGKGRKSSRQQPAFECMLYYHACGGDVLARIRTQYVEPLLRAERQRADVARRTNDETAAALATNRIQELEAFATRLRQVADEGFACPELDKLLENEPLDRWTGDGYLAPAERGDLVHQERAWRVDLNDGVRVNIAPPQLAGLLVSDVLKAVDAKKAIADRARWRSDERRWVRAGKLPRPGWMNDAVLESQKWTEMAPQRAAEKAKLEEKRKKIVEADS